MPEKSIISDYPAQFAALLFAVVGAAWGVLKYLGAQTMKQLATDHAELEKAVEAAEKRLEAGGREFADIRVKFATLEEAEKSTRERRTEMDRTLNELFHRVNAVEIYCAKTSNNCKEKN